MSVYVTHEDEGIPLEEIMQPLATEPEPMRKGGRGKRERMYRLLGVVCIVIVLVFFIVAISRGGGKKEEV